MEVITVGFRVVCPNLKHFGNKSNARPALDLDDDIEGIRDVGLDRQIWNFDAALQDACREARNALSCRVCVDGRERPAVTGV